MYFIITYTNYNITLTFSYTHEKFKWQKHDILNARYKLVWYTYNSISILSTLLGLVSTSTFKPSYNIRRHINCTILKQVKFLKTKHNNASRDWIHPPIFINFYTGEREIMYQKKKKKKNPPAMVTIIYPLSIKWQVLQLENKVHQNIGQVVLTMTRLDNVVVLTR